MVVAIGPLARGEVAGVCARVRAVLEGAPGAPLVCDVSAVVRPDLVTVDVLARLRLAAKRYGRAYRIRDAPPALGDMLGLLGLERAVPVDDPGEPADRARASPGGAVLRDRLQPVREAEQREQLLGVEEGVHADDAPL